MGFSISHTWGLAHRDPATRVGIGIAILGLVAVADFVSGSRVTLLFAYVLMVMYAAWYVGARFAILVSLLAAASQFADARPWETGWFESPVHYWNGLTRAASFLAITWMVRANRWNFDRVTQRSDEDSAALKSERSLSRSLRGELMIRETERRRIGRDLHDGLSQHLTATMLASRTLEEKLADHSPAEAADAHEVTSLLREALGQVRDVSCCLCPADLSSSGLPHALGRLAATTQRTSGVRCRFFTGRMEQACEESVATHLYRIAQEAVTNSLRHAHPGRIVIALSAAHGQIELSVSDNGTGFAPRRRARDGLGLRTMRARAGAIGGHLDLFRRSRGGTRVVCTVAAGEPDGGTGASHEPGNGSERVR